jgi:LmbE family N-acetylglucosaminyl deacetylase
VLGCHLGEDISAAGGLIAAVVARDIRVDLLAVTETDGGTPSDLSATPPWLLGRRRAARHVAYQRLGVQACRRDSLNLSAGKAQDAGDDVVAALSEIIGFAPAPTHAIWVLAPWRHERHPDHAAVGHSAAIATHAYQAQLLEYPIEGWGLDDPAPLPCDNARTLALNPLLRARKHRALASMLYPTSVDAIAEHEVYFL